MLGRVAEFDTVPSTFRLPSRLSLARYIRAYIAGFHEHLPFLHIPSMSFQETFVELLLAMAAVGAQYCFEPERGVELFHAARAIATERIRRRDATVASAQRDSGLENLPCSAGNTDFAQTGSHTANGPLGLPSSNEPGAAALGAGTNLMQSAQALLILMAMATWANHGEILREALAIQSVLASIVREDGLDDQRPEQGVMSWERWVRRETAMRTKYTVFCFFNLHCIVYDIPPLILSSEINMKLPSGAAEFRADTMAKWQEARSKSTEPSQFQSALRQLFLRDGHGDSERHSSLSNYILVHALVQNIFFVRQAARYRFDSPELTTEDISTLENALRTWQLGWERNPESSLDPRDPNGPVAFNSTALLSLAYTRLNMDTGPGRALGTRDPLQIASSLRNVHGIRRTPSLVRALLHAAHALSIPIKIGVRLVAKTQTFIWSIQHSLCSLECVLLMSKWLTAISMSEAENSEPPVTPEEEKVLSIVRALLDETEFAIPADNVSSFKEMTKYLNVGTLRVWATIFQGPQTWAIVDVIGNSLSIYADMLEAT